MRGGNIVLKAYGRGIRIRNLEINSKIVVFHFARFSARGVTRDTKHSDTHISKKLLQRMVRRETDLNLRLTGNQRNDAHRFMDDVARRCYSTEALETPRSATT